MNPSSRRLPDAALFREIEPGFERLTPGLHMPRHQHFSAYATVVLDGTYVQASYAGRVRLVPGDVLVQPTLDRHDSRTRRGSGLHLLRLEWQLDPGVGGVYRLDDVDQVIRTARRDPHEASLLLLHLVAQAQLQPVLKEDWPDLLAQMLTGSVACPIGGWAQSVGLARETVARGFFKVFGASPRTFGAQLKARAAWLRAVQGTESLAAIAADLGFADQPHMTRAVSALTGAPPHAWRRRQGQIDSRQMESHRL